MDAQGCFKGSTLQEIKSLREQGIDPVVSRYAEVDIAYPANEKEYCALSSYSIVKITAISDNPEELPIERAYFKLGKGKEIPLESLEVSVDDKPNFTNKIIETKDDKNRTYFKSFSFWVIPTGLFLDEDGSIAIDFKGERKNFVILRGPWKLDSRICEWVKRHTSGQLQVAEHVPYEVVASFIEREFLKA